MKITRLGVGRMDRQTELEIVVEIVVEGVVEIGRKLESKLLCKLVTILSYTRGQTLLASGSHVTYRISSLLW